MENKREKTISKTFYDDEIKGVMQIDGRKVIYLKPRVTRKRFYDWFDDEAFSHINQEAINYEKAEYFKKVIMGEDDFTND